LKEEKKKSGCKRTIGTPNYMAPEILPGAADTYNIYLVDWWAVGCILYEILVGAFCFGG